MPKATGSRPTQNSEDNKKPGSELKSDQLLNEEGNKKSSDGKGEPAESTQNSEASKTKDQIPEPKSTPEAKSAQSRNIGSMSDNELVSALYRGEGGLHIG